MLALPQLMRRLRAKNLCSLEGLRDLLLRLLLSLSLSNSCRIGAFRKQRRNVTLRRRRITFLVLVIALSVGSALFLLILLRVVAAAAVFIVAVVVSLATWRGRLLLSVSSGRWEASSLGANEAWRRNLLFLLIILSLRRGCIGGGGVRW